MKTLASETGSITESKAESLIFDEIADSIEEIESKFAKSGITLTEDEIFIDIASATGLKKTEFSEVLYEDIPLNITKKVLQTRISKSPMLKRRKSMENCSSATNINEEMLRRIPVYRSVRKSQQHKEEVPFKENTWNGRSSVSPTKKRAAITSETYKFPSRTASLTRNTPVRSSQCSDSRIRQRSATRTSASVNTSPNKASNLSSPLAQQLLEAAGKAKNDAQILEKIKQILNDHAIKSKTSCDSEELTCIHINGDKDNDGSGENWSKKNSSNSFLSDVNPLNSLSETNTALRRIEKGASKIPAPVRSNTGLY